MNDGDTTTTSSPESGYGLDAVFGYNLDTINYVNRPALEETLKLHMKPSGQGVVLYGPTGCGKSTTLRFLLDELAIKPITIECDHANDQNAIISKINAKINERTNLLGRLENVFVFRFFRFILKIFTTYGDAAIETLQKKRGDEKKREDVIVEIGDRRMVCVIERAERLYGEAIDGLEHFLDDCTDILPSRIKKASSHNLTVGPCVIVCVAASKPMTSSTRTTYERFHSVHVPAMDREEIFKILDQGASILNVAFTNVAKEAIAESAIGVPLACKLIAFKCLQEKGIFSRYDGQPAEIGIDSVEDVRYQLGKEKAHQLDGWIKYLNNTSKIEYKVLHLLAQSGHTTSLSVIYNNIEGGRSSKSRKDSQSTTKDTLIDIVNRLGSDAEQYGLSGIIVKDNTVSFQVPFLLEALRHRLLKNV